MPTAKNPNIVGYITVKNEEGESCILPIIKEEILNHYLFSIIKKCIENKNVILILIGNCKSRL